LHLRGAGAAPLIIRSTNLSHTTSTNIVGWPCETKVPLLPRCSGYCDPLLSPVCLPHTALCTRPRTETSTLSQQGALLSKATWWCIDRPASLRNWREAFPVSSGVPNVWSSIKVTAFITPTCAAVLPMAAGPYGKLVLSADP